MSKNYTVIDLFSGAGGLSQGFVQAGYKLLAGIDFDDAALKTYDYNFPWAKALKVDLFNAENAMKYIDSKINQEIVDVVIAGPPCQGFSLTGGRDINDTRNTLYLAVVYAVKYFNPKAFLIENVPGMATLYKGRVKQQIINTFEEMGYSVTVTDKPMLAADYGVPQIRKRVFFVGYKKDLGFEYFKFPEPILNPENYIGTADAISDLPSLENTMGEEISKYESATMSNYQELMRKNATVLYNHVGTNHTGEVKWVINQVPEGGNHKDLPPGVGESRKFNEAWTRYHSLKPSKTIDTGHRNHFHYKWNRVPTVRENARLQSFPDDFRFLGTKTQQNKQVGNAVPPILAQVIAETMRKHFESQSQEIKDMNKAKKLNSIELFAGAGGLLEGFKKTENYELIAAVEWLKPQVRTLINRLKKKYKISNAEKRVLYFDVQRTNELIHGWKNDEIFGSSKGLNSLVGDRTVDIISGGPPCQAYSMAGRVRDTNGMKDDYRNFLFESYIRVVEQYRPKLIVFENVEGILSAIPTGEKITDIIRKSFDEIGYEMIGDLRKHALLDLTEYGVPQKRKRVIIIAIRRDKVEVDYQKLLTRFYNEILTREKNEKVVTVREAIGDLPPIIPLKKPTARIAYEDKKEVNGHYSRFHSLRDKEIFKILTEDILTGKMKYTNASALIDLYYKKTGKRTNVHKYHVLKWDEPSNTIPAHLKKDGLRHIHPDSIQQRTISVREAARLQTFDDDFEFNEPMGASFEMIGNAVPPLFAYKLAKSITELYRIINIEEEKS